MGQVKAAAGWLVQYGEGGQERKGLRHRINCPVQGRRALSADYRADHVLVKQSVLCTLCYCCLWVLHLLYAQQVMCCCLSWASPPVIPLKSRHFAAE